MARSLAIALRQAWREANGFDYSSGERPLHLNGPTLYLGSGTENVKCAQGSRKVDARLQSARRLRVEQDGFALRRQVDTSAVALQELDAELALKAWNLLAQRSLRDETVAARRGRSGAQLQPGRSTEVAQLPAPMQGAASADGLLRAAAAREALAATSSKPCGSTLARSS
jgi:hypothetical protein